MEKLAKNFLKAFFILLGISIIIVAVAGYFIFKNQYLGPAFFGLGILSFLFMKIIGIKIKDVYPDLTFGIIDNILLISAAIIGGSIGGVGGAIVGGVAGNTIADGISGLFEGYVSEREAIHKIKTARKMISSSLGKITGCMFGAGIVLTFTWAISLI